jgi:hypothetical protein
VIRDLELLVLPLEDLVLLRWEVAFCHVGHSRLGRRRRHSGQWDSEEVDRYLCM